MQVFRSSSRLANAMRALIARSAEDLHFDFLCEAVRSAFSGAYTCARPDGRQRCGELYLPRFCPHIYL